MEKSDEPFAEGPINVNVSHGALLPENDRGAVLFAKVPLYGIHYSKSGDVGFPCHTKWKARGANHADDGAER